MPEKHTPGPWRYQHQDGYTPDKGHIIRTYHHTDARWDGTMIAEVNGLHRHTLSAPESIEANARLIAAAPDLLAACEAAKLALRATSQRDKDYSGELRLLNAAIAKARGET